MHAGVRVARPPPPVAGQDHPHEESCYDKRMDNRMRRRVARCIMTMACGAALGAHAAPPPPAAQREITHLLDYLVASGCAFQRSGTWYDAGAARKHLEMKLDYLTRRDMVKTADDFLKLAATSSSMYGDVYKVRCGTQAPLPSADWLGAELARLRQQKAAPK